MTSQRKTAVTPHRCAVDLSPLEGHEVLGESLAVLFSFALRIRFKKAGHGTASFSGTWPTDEAEAVMRAMDRVEPDAVEDQRTDDQRNADRLVAVLFEVTAALDKIPRPLQEPF